MYSRIFAFFIAAALFNCASKPDPGAGVVGKIFQDTVVTNSDLPVRIKAVVDSDTICLLTSEVNGKKQIIDTLNTRDAIARVNIEDFDKDGHADILVSYFSNNPIHFLYLFDPLTHIFRSIEGYTDFPYGTQLDTNPAVYYSYQRNGCAGLNWISDLFTIDDFEITHLAHIAVAGCEDAKQEILVYRVKHLHDSGLLLVDSIKYPGNINHLGMDVVQEYWNENYTKFLEP